jgi:hypothetical protein
MKFQGRQYDVAPDGRFLINTVLDSATAPIPLLMHWNTESANWRTQNAQVVYTETGAYVAQGGICYLLVQGRSRVLAPDRACPVETHCESPKNCNAEEGASRSPAVLPSMRG